METFFASSTFFLLGLIVGAFLTGLAWYKLSYVRHYEEEDYEDEENALEGIKIVLQQKPEKRQINEALVNLDTFKEQINKKMIYHQENDEYEKSAYLKLMLENCDNWFDERKQWFLSRIGKTITMEKITCDCDGCKDAYENGIVVEDKTSALTLFLHENFSKLHFKEFEFVDFKE